MKAVVYDRYGGPEVLSLTDVPVPEPAADQVLIRVRATALNLSDWESLRGTPFYSRIGGLRAPRRGILGSDIAGVIEAVGSSVAGFAPGDAVYSDNLVHKGGFAEYAVAPASTVAHKPPELGFAEAAALPQSGAIALQGTAGITSGMSVLINGAGGGTGAFAIQLARRAGARVTGVDNAGKLDFLRALGADEVLDYRVTDFTRTGPYDRILDLVALRSVFAYRRALARGGRYRCVGGTTRAVLRTATAGALLGLVTGRSLGVLVVKEGPAHFEPLARMCVAGKIDIHLDRTFPLEEAPLALAYVGAGRALGKVVVEID
ncbi:NAD(P)-dependent alcohol dehydrogenase [Nocardia sp. NPDC058379]|uniref:NAD(P)-dependent alcohol dehydrogenase n=1 Tax=unclassified Nocardia TaxID=2637762 RepID=UPI003651A8F9